MDNKDKNSDANIVSSSDQILKINNIYGKVNDQDTAFISNVNIRDYQEQTQSPNPRQFDSFMKKKFNLSGAKLLQMLMDLLEYNPYFRPTAKECLKNPIFDSIRVQQLERDAMGEIELECDKILPIDYDTGYVKNFKQSSESNKLIIDFLKVNMI